MSDHLYIVTYDIADSRRWRRIHKTLKGYGEWIQFSIFQCRLSNTHKAELEKKLKEAILVGQDHVLIFDIGPVASADLRIKSIGKKIDIINRKAIII